MIDLSVYSREGQEVDTLKVDESVLGGSVRYPLLKQAIVMYHANKRVGTAATKGRSMVVGSGIKLFRQKGTGRARVGNIRTGKRVGGGVTFAKLTRDFGKRMPKKQKRLARDSAILAKLLSNDVVVVDELKFERPRTGDFANILNNLQIKSIKLLTNNPEKIKQLTDAGIKIIERLPLITEPTEFSKAYIETKAKRSGHLLGDLANTRDIEKIRSMPDLDSS